MLKRSYEFIGGPLGGRWMATDGRHRIAAPETTQLTLVRAGSEPTKSPMEFTFYYLDEHLNAYVHESLR